MEQNSGFTITLEKEFIIYGASYIGRRLYHALSAQGYHVVAFLDKNADQFAEISGKAVFVPDNTLISREQKNAILIIVAISNYKEHPFVAKYLHKLGYKNIIFRPPSPTHDQAHFAAMNDVYDFLEAGKEIKNMVLAEYSPIDTEKSFAERYCENIDDKCCKAYIPTELLFYEKDQQILSAYQSVPLLPFYQFIAGKGSEDFLKGYFKTNAAERDWERWMEEERTYYKHFSFNSDFHQLNDVFLPKVSWDEKGCFIVQDHLRYVIYQMVSCHSKVLCLVNKEDYEKWMNSDKLAACLDALTEGDLSFVYTPIPHPAFYDFPCKREECGKTRLLTICQYFYENTSSNQR